MKRAIVIGASSGIGYELAKILVKNEYIVGVMARRVHLLEELCSETGNGLFWAYIDASDADSAQSALSGLIGKMNGVDLVVISAGTGHLNEELQWPFEDDTIRTNVTGFCALANVALKHFLQKGSGHLLGISSVAALRGGRQAPAYNASKAFVTNYLEGLRQKVRKAGLPITITDVRPGFVKTAMAQGEGIFWAANADTAAMQIFDAIQKKKSVAYVTRRWRLVAWAARLIPGFLYERL
jgi:short-subunit dehydrogenase